MHFFTMSTNNDVSASQSELSKLVYEALPLASKVPSESLMLGQE